MTIEDMPKPHDGKTHDDGKTLGDQPPDATVRQDSDRLFEEIGRLKRLESEKQRTFPTTPEFHAAAAKVEQQARKVLEAAKAETVHGHDAAREHEGEHEPTARAERRH